MECSSNFIYRPVCRWGLGGAFAPHPPAKRVKKFRSRLIKNTQSAACLANLSRNCTRNHLRRPKIQNFPGVACPQTPLAARFAC